MKYAFYPGCSLEVNAAAYDVSTHAIAPLLGLELQEIDDWNCCGATEYFSQDELTACSVIARNLALVDQDIDQVTAPCAACFLNLKKVDRIMTEQPELSGKISQALAAGGLSYEGGRLKVRHLLELVVDDVGEETIRSKVTRPLEGLRVAAYYGCQVTRPWGDNDNTEYPTKLDQLLTWLGAEVVDYPVKSHCCGGHMTQISEPEAFELIRRLLQSAEEYKTDVIACLCPMCQLNLDAYQSRVNGMFNTSFNIPILYFTQLVGLALGVDTKKLGFGKEIVSAQPVLREKVNV